MLSRVLSRRNAGLAQPMVFPLLAPGSGSQQRGALPRQETGDPASVKAVLQEKQRLLEAAVAERRDALENGRRQGDQEARAELLPIMERLNASIAEMGDRVISFRDGRVAETHANATRKRAHELAW